MKKDKCKKIQTAPKFNDKDSKFANLTVPNAVMKPITGKGSKIFLEDIKSAKANKGFIKKFLKKLEEIAEEIDSRAD